ncbi:TIGR02206 family membrane protein [Paenibacillus sp. UMB4589-SE434]|uniref:YwaF family protein n=1 Tax=Paenibacillus sp. UMB4589-SE434 TaxID=3046314 RepID=UPI002549F4C1|nr:TIGR02206 family membrane protein [Paenibacillus sp. UMB4589-SE434]MDK8180483.1 TIGR02206 family membrane protein [Paenibacillus sp. UMB4589-SE434]
MNRYFDVNHTQLFTFYSPAHLSALSAFVLCLILLYVNRQRLHKSHYRKYGRFILAAVLVLCEVTLNIWYITQGVFRLQDTLPLELCSISLYLCVFMLLFNNRFLFQIVYFTGIGGALQAILTPALTFDFPHYRFLEFFIAHFAIMLAVLYMVWVEQYRPTFKSVGLAMAFLNVLLVVVGSINYAVGGNYMFLMKKPDTASMLDLLGPYPWYLLSLEAVAFVLFILLYLPFIFVARAQLSRNKLPLSE